MSPLDCKEIKSILKEINPEYSLEGLILKLQYFGHLMPSIFPRIRVFSNESTLHIRWPMYQIFSISPSNEHSGLISFRIDDLKASFLQRSAFFMVQLSHPYITSGKTIALTILTFVGRMISLFFNMLSRFIIAFLPRRNHLLVLWLQSPSAVILEPKKIKSVTVFVSSPIYLP